MTNAELIKALRRLSTAQDTDNSLDWVYGSQQAMHDAADALEAAEKRIAELIEAVANRDRLADDLNKYIWKLEAQLPKEGEWIMDGKYNRHCSRCNEDVVWSFNYCPNCGARMRTVTDCHTLEEGER